MKTIITLTIIMAATSAMADTDVNAHIGGYHIHTGDSDYQYNNALVGIGIENQGTGISAGIYRHSYANAPDFMVDGKIHDGDGPLNGNAIYVGKRFKLGEVKIVDDIPPLKLSVGINASIGYPDYALTNMGGVTVTPWIGTDIGDLRINTVPGFIIGKDTAIMVSWKIGEF